MKSYYKGGISALLLTAVFLFLFHFWDRWPVIVGISCVLLLIPSYMEAEEPAPKRKWLVAASLFLANLAMILLFSAKSLMAYQLICYLGACAACFLVLLIKSLVKRGKGQLEEGAQI